MGGLHAAQTICDFHYMKVSDLRGTVDGVMNKITCHISRTNIKSAWLLVRCSLSSRELLTEKLSRFFTSF